MSNVPEPVQQFFAKKTAASPREDERRRFPRRDVSNQVTAHLSTTLPAFPRKNESKAVYLYDVSRQGIGLLCDSQLYPEEQLRLELPGSQHREVLVKRCVRLQSGWFQIGGTFVR